jgi:hypothetical protein
MTAKFRDTAVSPFLVVVLTDSVNLLSETTLAKTSGTREREIPNNTSFVLKVMRFILFLRSETVGLLELLCLENLSARRQFPGSIPNYTPRNQKIGRKTEKLERFDKGQVEKIRIKEGRFEIRIGGSRFFAGHKAVTEFPQSCQQRPPIIC